MLCSIRRNPILTNVIRSQLRRHNSTSNVEAPKKKTITKVGEGGVIEFTKSEAYLNYRASSNFYGGDDRDLPGSHNYVLAGTGIFSTFYLIFLRDDIENDGGKNLFQPLHEQMPELAIPLIQSAIEENRKQGRDTKKLEKKLKELLEDPEKYGMTKPKLIEN